MNRALFVAPTLFAALSLTGCDLQTETIDYSPMGAPRITKIVTSVDIGDVTIRPSSAITATHVEAEAQWLAEKPKVEFRVEGTTLFVETDCLDEDPQCRVDITLSAPVTAALEVRGEETTISASGLDGAMTFTTAVGDITLADMAGKLTLTASEGQIRGDDLDSGDVTSVVEEGDTVLEFTGGAANLNVTATTGNVRLVVPPTSYRIDAGTSDGEVDLGVVASSTAKGQIKVRVRHGDISIQPQLALTHEQIDFKLDRTIRYEDAPISLRFDAIVEDSRCPSSTDCVWAGRFIANMTMTREDGSTRNFMVQLDKPITVFGYSVQLTDVRPYPTEGKTIPAKDYVITLAVERS